jgi:hypothetical protein
MKTKNIFSGFISLPEIIGNQKEKGTAVSDKFSISYLKHSYWFNYSYKATIDQNGLLHITENSGLNHLHRSADYHIADNEVDLIKGKLREVSSIDFNNNYGFGANKPTDLPVTFIKYDVDNKADATSIYLPEENELPEELNLFLSTFERIIMDNDTFLKNSLQ